jgi:alpha-L-fucosidase
MCETLNGHWGVGAKDLRFKSPGTIIENLCACRKVGANYLLNVGPTATGGIGDYEAALLRLVGRWASSHGDLLYRGRPVPAQTEGRDFLLEKDGRLYYLAHDLSREGSEHVIAGGSRNSPRSIKGFPVRTAAIRWMDDNSSAAFIQSGDGSLLTIDCRGYDYGTDMVVRVAEITPQAESADGPA